jgi:hypothetical protein
MLPSRARKSLRKASEGLAAADDGEADEDAASDDEEAVDGVKLENQDAVEKSKGRGRRGYTGCAEDGVKYVDASMTGLGAAVGELNPVGALRCCVASSPLERYSVSKTKCMASIDSQI